MSFRNQLEPASLLKSYEDHPPDGFEFITEHRAAAAPAFAAPLDLLTTADRTLRRFIQALPSYSLWRGILRPRVAFVGTTVSEYMLLHRAADVRELPARWKRSWRSRFALLVVKDIPQHSPFLSDAENSSADALAQACSDEGYVLLDGQALAYVSIDFAHVDGYLARLSSARRKDLRRKMRSLDSLEVARVPTGSAHFADDRLVDRYYDMYLAVFGQSEVKFDRLSRDFFSSVLHTPGGIVFEYRCRGTDEPALVGWNLCFVYGGRLVDKYIGFQYPAARKLNLYFVSWMVNLGYAIEAGLTHYVAGWTDPEVKARLGAEFTYTRHAVYVRNRFLRLLARCLSGRLASDRRLVSAAS
jgi:hypothetical protein